MMSIRTFSLVHIGLLPLGLFVCRIVACMSHNSQLNLNWSLYCIRIVSYSP